MRQRQIKGLSEGFIINSCIFGGIINFLCSVGAAQTDRPLPHRGYSNRSYIIV